MCLYTTTSMHVYKVSRLYLLYGQFETNIENCLCYLVVLCSLFRLHHLIAINQDGCMFGSMVILLISFIANIFEIESISYVYVCVYQ